MRSKFEESYYNSSMATLNTIETLLEAANSSTEGDTSVNTAKRQFIEQAESESFFKRTCAKLLDIAQWNRNSSPTSYKLFNESGAEIGSQPIEVGGFIRIALYGSGKYDWVRVVEIFDRPNEFIVKVKPSYDPTEDPADQSSTSHFFVPQAENNFCVQLNDKTVAFYVIGINEKQNTKFTDGLIESARNSAVANIGYYTGLQKSVWKEFASNFLATEEEKND